MHAVLEKFSGEEAREKDLGCIFAAASPAPRPGSPYQPSAYRPPRMRGPALAVVAAVHAVLLVLIASTGFVQADRKEPAPLVIDVIELPTDPPNTPPPPDQPVPVKPAAPQIVTPAPVIMLPPAALLVHTVAEPPPPATVVVPPQPARPVGPVTTADLSTSIISATPPKYPLESRRKREQGTVVLNVLVGTSGGVEQVSIAKSSGFSRLDKAALDAVRRWRWSPAVRSGRPVMVKGYVDIPFVLT